MACYYPMRAYRAVDVSPKTGKRPILFRPQGAYTDLALVIPCGRCIGCKLEQSRQWAVRCVHEASLYDRNCFLTLTYNNDNLPKDGSLKKNDFQNFMKRLRRKLKNEVRFFACGEYGENLSRAHYHALIFGYEPEDKEVHISGEYRHKKNRFSTKDLDTVYKSEEIANTWQKGFCTVGSVNFDSAGYVARYCRKKITGDKAISHYGKKIPEFGLMSRKPGIGKKWIEKYLTDVYPKDFFTINGVKMRPPRYYDTHLDEVNPKLFKKIKIRRAIADREHYENIDEKHRQGKFKKLQTKTLNRRLHYE